MGRALGVSSFLAARNSRYLFLSYLLGSFAGIMEHVGMFPLDTVKVTLFLQKYRPTYKQVAVTSVFSVLLTFFTEMRA